MGTITRTKLIPAIHHVVEPWPNNLNESGSNDICTFIGTIRYHLSVVYYLCKVRGRKYIQRFLPHHVSDVIPVWMTLQSILEYQHHTLTSAAATSSTYSGTANAATTEDVITETKIGTQQAKEIAPLWEQYMYCGYGCPHSVWFHLIVTNSLRLIQV